MEGEVISLRENSIGITYNEGESRKHHFGYVIEDILGVPEREVVGIDVRGNTRWLFMVNSKERYEYICETFTGRDILIDKDCRIQIDDISSRGTRVEVSSVPFSISNVQLSGMLRKYGEIYKCQNYYRTFGKYSKLNKTGDRIIWMNLHGNIPQQLNINKTQMIIHVHYNAQPMSCNKCGHTSHRARYCRRENKDFKNMIDIEDGYASDDDHNDDDIDEHYDDCDDGDNDSDLLTSIVPAIVYNADVHFDPSQNHNTFVCSECDYQCKYDHIFKEHMKNHIGEKQLENDILEPVNEARSACEKLVPADTHDNTFKCTECKFECGSRLDLSNHLTTHSIYACNMCDYKNNSQQRLKSHSRIHIQNKLKCSLCDFKATPTNTLINHMRVHLEDEICSAPLAENTSQSSYTLKRDLSVSPETADPNKKTRKNCKKSKKNIHT